MRARLYIVLGVAILLLGPMQGLTQYPQGGGMPGGGFGGFGGGKGGRGGFNFDPGQMFDQMAGGKSVVTLSEITDPRQQRMIERATQALGITNGQITREQYVTYSQQRMAQWGGGGATTPVSIVGATPGAAPAAGAPAPAPGGSIATR